MELGLTFFLSSFKQDSSSLEGLGGGIAWTMTPNFCEKILPQFREDTILSTLGAFWPIHDMLSLVYVCAIIDHSFITPALSHYPHYCNTIA